MVDIIIVAWLAAACLEGYKKGLYRSGLELVAFGGALLLGLNYYHTVSGWAQSTFGLPTGISSLLGFTFTFLFSSLVFFIVTEPISHILSRRLQSLYRYVLYRSAGAVTETFKAVILTSVILAVITFFPISETIKYAVHNSYIGNFLARKASSYEGPLRNVFVDSIEEGILFNTVSTARNDNPPRPGTPPKKYIKRLSGQEKEMFKLINNDRRKLGLPALTYDDKLSDVAAKHSLDMFKRNYFDHLSPEGNDLAYRLEKHGIYFSFAGENLAMAGNLSTAYDGLMNSEGHRRNILDPNFKKVGIGIIDGGPFQQLTTQNFTN